MARPCGQVASLQLLPSGQYGLCFGYCFSGPLPLRSHNGEVTFHGACFWELLVIRLHSEIGQIHLSTEPQCGSPVYLWVTTTIIVKSKSNKITFITTIIGCEHIVKFNKSKSKILYLFSGFFLQENTSLGLFSKITSN